MSITNISKSEINEVLEFITCFESGDFSKSLQKTHDPFLQLIIDQLNVTAKKMAAQPSSAIETRARINALFNQSGDAIMTLAPPTWKFTSCNSAALKLFKVLSQAEFISLGPWNLAPERQSDGSLSSEKAVAAIQQAMNTGIHFFEWDHATISGEILNCTVLLSRVDLPEESYLQATVRDISQEKFREHEFRSIFCDSPMGIVRLDSSFSYLSANPAYEVFLGYSEAELVNKSILDLIHPDDRGKILNKMKNLSSKSAAESLKSLEKRYLHKSGQIKWGRLTIQAVINAQGSFTYILILEDITEKKSNEIETAALSILGLTEDQLRGRTSMDPAWKAVKQDGSPFPGDEHPAMVALKTASPVKDTVMGLILPDHTERWIKINAIPFEGKFGRCVTCTFSNITELFNTQKEIRFVLDSFNIGVWKYNPINQSLYWDKSMYKLFDVNESEFSGHYQAWESTLTTESKLKAVEELEQALRGEKKFDTVFEIETKSKGKRFISGRGQVIRDQSGNPIMMYGVNIDVTAQKTSELERESITVLLDAVLQNVPSMISVKDYTDNGKFSLINKAGEKILGFKKENIIGKTDYDLFSNEAADSFSAKDKQSFALKSVLKIEQEEVDTPNGRRFMHSYKVPTFTQKNEPHLLIAISNDITDEVKIKKELELERSKSLKNAKLASLGEMSAGIAHEINNPLTIILSSLSLLPKISSNPEKLALKVDSIKKASDRIARIVGGLKKFSRSGEKANLKNYELEKIVHDSFILIDAKSKRHATPVTLDCKTKSHIFCDEVEIEQVLINLINNAIDALKTQSEKWVKVSLFDEDQWVVIRVTDSGSGIPDRIREKLFEPFFATKKIGEGTGLGLSIAKGILDEHKATIEVIVDSPNTCFEIKFPRFKEIKNAN